MVDGVANCAGHTGDADLSDAARAQRVEAQVRCAHEIDGKFLDVRIDRDVIFGKVGIDEPSGAERAGCARAARG